MADVSATISMLMAEYQARGISGSAAYAALADEPRLPLHLTVPQVMAITHDSEVALKMRRQRGQAPSFIKLTPATVLYPRRDLFLWLASRYVTRTPKSAAAEYAHQPEDNAA